MGVVGFKSVWVVLGCVELIGRFFLKMGGVGFKVVSVFRFVVGLNN